MSAPRRRRVQLGPTMSRKPNVTPALFFQLGQVSAVPRRPKAPDVRLAAVADAVEKHAFAAALQLVQQTPALLDQFVDDPRCWALAEYVPFSEEFPEAAEQMTTACALREGFKASMEAEVLGRRTRRRT